MTFEKAKQLNEELELIKFRYPSKSCKKPRVLVLDANYPGRVNEKKYGQRLDVLGVNLKYTPVSERKRMQKALSEIDLFSDFLGADKLERYQRLKDFAPDYLLPYIRRYNKSKMKNVKLKQGFFYHPYSFTSSGPEISTRGEAAE
jgi:hypothetical protein